MEPQRGRRRIAEALRARDPEGSRVGLRDLAPYLRPHRATLTAVAVLALAGSAGSLAQPLMIRRVLAAVQGHHPLAGPVAILIAVIVGSAVVGGLQAYLLRRSGEGLVFTIRDGLVRHLLRLPIAEYDRRRTGDLLSRVSADSTLLRAVVTSGLFESVSGLIVVIGAVVAMALIDPVLLGLTLVAVAVGASIVLGMARRVRDLTEHSQDRVGAMTAALQRALSSVRTIRASQAEERETAALSHLAREAYGAGVRAAKLESTVAPAGVVALQGALMIVLGVGGARVAAGALSVADLVAFVLYLFLLVMPLAQALQAFTTVQIGLGALQRIESIRAVPEEGAQDRPTGAHPEPAAALLEFADVHFAYPNGRTVLRGVSFAVPRGTRTAVVGPSGAGKSTCMALVERFYDVTAGAIRLGGVDLRDLPRHELRGRVGYVEQEAPVLAGTLRDNLLLAAPDATPAEVDAVVDAVNLRELVERIPHGLDSDVGDAGVLLSGGERQRLAIARSLLAHAELLLLDEPTSHLDARNEMALRHATDAVARHHTLLVVAHRLSTVVDADQIVVLDNGAVVAVGTHDELVERSPLYREFAASQLLTPVDPVPGPPASGSSASGAS